MLLFICFAAAGLGCVLLYLGHPNQRWLKQPLSQQYGMWLASAVLLGALVLAGYSMSTATALFAWMALLMLLLGVLPFMDIVFRRARHD